MKKSAFFCYTSLALSFGALLLLALLVTCGGGGGGSSSSPSTGTVTTSISDPPTCQTAFQNVWVTITRVRAHVSGSAGPNDNGWVDLRDLRDAPMQIDLMNLSQTDCLLTQLGSTSGIPAGQYQQIRLFLLSNNPSGGTALPNPSNCGSNGFNCVVTSSGTQTLQLSSEAQTGIKIPSGQIAGGSFIVSAGQVVDLDIDFDACSSIVQQGNGQFRLKPVLHAAEVSLSNPVKISGRVVDSLTQTPISGAVVFLEQPDASGIDRMVMQTLTKSDGTFIFCPVPAGNFDVVADALVSTRTGDIAYNATITFNVPSGTAMGSIPIVAETVAETGTNTSPATISGQITTTTNKAGTQADISLSALQTANGISVTIPPLGSSTPNVTTQSMNSCPQSTDCIGYTLIVPASNPSVGRFPVTNYSVPVAAQFINYTVNAQAFTTPSNPTPGEAECSSPSLTVQVTVQAGVATTNQDFSFTGCQ